MLPNELWNEIIGLAYPPSHNRTLEPKEFVDDDVSFQHLGASVISERARLADLRRICKHLEPIILEILFTDIQFHVSRTVIEDLYRLLSSETSRMRGVGSHTRRLTLKFSSAEVTCSTQLLVLRQYFPSLRFLLALSDRSDPDDSGMRPLVHSMNGLLEITWSGRICHPSEILHIGSHSPSLRALRLGFGGFVAEDLCLPVPSVGIVALSGLERLQIPGDTFGGLASHLSTPSLQVLSTSVPSTSQIPAFHQFIERNGRNLVFIHLVVYHFISTEDREQVFAGLHACPQLTTLSVVPRRNHLWPWLGHHTDQTLETLILWPKSITTATLHLRPMSLHGHKFGFSTLFIRFTSDAWSRSVDADQEYRELKLQLESWKIPDVSIFVELWQDTEPHLAI